MKKALCFLLCAVLLLTFGGCGNKEPETPTAASTSAVTSTTTEAATTTTTPTTTAPTLSEEESWEQVFNTCIEEFLQAWQDGDADGLEHYVGTKQMAALLADEVSVESYRVERSTDEKPHRLTLTVSKSGVPSIPKGESEWWIRATDDYAGVYVELCPIDEEYAARWTYLRFYDSLPVQFCNEIAGELGLFDTVADCSRLSPQELGAKGGTLVRIHNSWLKIADENAEAPSHLTVSELSKFTEQVLGVTVTDFSKSPTYTPPTETEEAQVELGAYGGLWHYGGLAEHTQKDGVHTVTICYYADITRLVEAVTMRYTVKETDNGFRLLSCERLSGGTYPPVRGTT